jgi:NAD(P)H-hydrate epimerase
LINFMDTQPAISPAARLVSVAEMQAIEKASDAAGHSYAAMMARAGEAVAGAIRARYGAQPALVLCGPGNNGGDGLVCAHYLHAAGVPVRVYLWQRRTDTEHDYQGHFARLAALGVPAAAASADPGCITLQAWLAESRVLVDALLGTGANRPIDGVLAELLRTVSAAQKAGHLHVVAVDCASGLNCDTGAVDPLALTPDLTVTFGFAKHGHYQFPGAEQVGELVVADIGIPSAAAGDLRTFLITPDLVAGWLPARPRLSHKGTFGKALLAVGSELYPGAAYLSCAAAARTGAGLVTGAVPRPVWPLVAGRLAEPTWLPLPVQAAGDLAGWVEPGAAATVADKAAGYDAFVLGCGLGNNAATRAFVAQLLPPRTPRAGYAPETAPQPAPQPAPEPSPAHLIDADGLNCLAALPDWPSRLPARCVLTPHPAEMARLCGLAVSEVVAGRWDLARTQAAAWGCTVLLKGPYTVVAAPTGLLGVLPIATPALATAGSGDVMSGIIGGLLAQGLGPFAAACTGVWLHGQAGLRCEQALGRAGVIASDLLPQLPAVLQSLAV